MTIGERNSVHKMIIFFNRLLLQKEILFIFIETDINKKYIYNLNIILKAFLFNKMQEFDTSYYENSGAIAFIIITIKGPNC